MTQLRQMAVRIPGGVGAIIFRHFAEQELAFRIAAGAGHSRSRVDDHFPRRVDQSKLCERDEREQRRGRIAAGGGNEIGSGVKRPWPRRDAPYTTSSSRGFGL